MGAETQMKRLIKTAATKLQKSGKDKNASRFVTTLFQQGVEEEITAYSAEDLAIIAASAQAFMQKKMPGRHKVRVFNPADGKDGWSEDISVIEIVNDDMPFLVDSVLSLLSDLGLGIRLVLHPILTLNRKPDGTMDTLLEASSHGAPGVVRESFIHVHIDPLLEESERTELEDQITRVLNDVRTAVLDWRPMRDRVGQALSFYQTNPPPVAVDELAESIQFLQWLLDNHFTFLGIREYAFESGGAKGELVSVKGSGLGILRDPKVQVLRRGREHVTITPELREFLMQPAPLIITKANVRATVHRRVHMDYIGIKQFDEMGQLSGELRVVGLFTSAAYTRSVRMIPVLRRKVAYIVEHSGFDPDGHNGKALVNIIEQYPRDDLFQIDADLMLETAKGILQLEERPRTRMFIRRDKFERFVSSLVYIPRDRFNTQVRSAVGEKLAEAYDGYVSAFYPAFPEGLLVRVHFIIGRTGGETPHPDLRQLEDEIIEIVKTWDDRLNETISGAFQLAEAHALRKRYTNAFSVAYQEAYQPADALRDIELMESLHGAGDLAIDFYRAPGDAESDLRLKLYHEGEPIALSDRLPILENMGLKAIDERSYNVAFQDEEGGVLWIHDIALSSPDAEEIDLDRIKSELESCFLAVWEGRAENDAFNGLVLKENIGWRDISILRAIGKYLRLGGMAFSASLLETTLVAHSGIAAQLVKLFYARFEPDDGLTDKKRANAEKRLVADIEAALQNVPSLDQDSILRRYVNLITVALRTNYFQTTEDGAQRPAIAIKIRSREVDGLPAPKPFAEIFVYAPDIEGVHLRFGMIARGGLRWSDRPEDFRTEVLGLVKAQQVKNAVIVPVGSKGGFVPKRLSSAMSRDEFMAEGVRCYKVFISSLLDVTDNISGADVVPPKQVVRHDGDDPYLVVAADKGTATFSDIANGISEEKGHWLGDAFASGGSAGYDHKKMGITARGGWEAVKRHFREMDNDIQTTPFTVVGCGDMSGDVFGNGMLLSKQIRLVAAFDHRDIFIDPDPDPAISFKERQRLFNTPGTSWQDYDPKLISKGGGVFSRSLKSIEVSAEIQEVLDLKTRKLSPFELIRAILMSETDLLWFGGIGTYIRASTETNADAGDRANDPVRITPAELRVKVIGEGANLGLTQRARIEFALNGGRVNTDAVDNSAGVNSSDLEVNIKIALGAAEAAGKLTRAARNKFLAAMTDNVAELCLRNNYNQTLSLTLSEERGLADIGFQSRLMRNLEHDGLLDRAVEFLPDDVEMSERESQGKPLTRPELSVLLAYAKITLFDRLLESSVPDEDYLDRDLMRYFPTKLQSDYGEEIANHRLKREIIATMLSNSMINRGGPAFVNRLSDETGSTTAEIATAYVLARDSFDFIDLNGEIDALDNKVPSALQIELYLAVQDLVRQQTVWFLLNVPTGEDLGARVAHFHDGLGELEAAFEKVLPKDLLSALEDERDALVSQKVPKDLAQKIVRLAYLSRGPDIIHVATQNKHAIADVARVFYGLGDALNIDRLSSEAASVPMVDYYDRLAVTNTLDAIHVTQRDLAAQILASGKGKKNAWDAWFNSHQHTVARTQAGINELLAGTLTVAKLAVAASHLRALLQS